MVLIGSMRGSLGIQATYHFYPEPTSSEKLDTKLLSSKSEDNHATYNKKLTEKIIKYR